MAEKQANVLNKDNREILNESGMRSTNQRTLILDIIKKGKGHLDADDVYREARKKQPRLSLSTVYRNLQKLKQQGLIEERHFDEAHHHYEIKASEEHHHLVCLNCGKIIEFECSFSEKMKEEVSRSHGFEIVSSEVQMNGYCPDCHEKRTDEA